MRTRISLIILFLLIIPLACKKTDKETPSAFKATKDGSQWITTSTDAKLNKFNSSFLIIGRKKDPNYNQEESLLLSFSIVDFSAPEAIENISARWIYVVGGDAISDQYQIDTTLVNKILITSLDTVNKTISGKFTINLIRDKYYTEAGEMSFKDGTFNLPYQEITTFD